MFCAGLVTLSLTRACMVVIKCLKEERDWLVLNLVLAEVPSVLQNKGMLTRSLKGQFHEKSC